MIKRDDYMEGHATYRDYYGQFVTEGIRSRVVARFGIERLKACLATDANLNNIPLADWDCMGVGDEVNRMLKEAGDIPALATSVCILKEAATQATEA